MPRVYEHKFDWDEARRLRAEGLTYTQIAERLGVTAQAVGRACDEAQRQRAMASSGAWTRGGQCPDCGAQTTRHSKGGDHRCRECYALAQATTVRDDTLQCVRCKEWRTDEEFPHNRAENGVRRGRHTTCRHCQAAMRQKARESRMIPCARCGKPRLDPRDTGPRPGNTGLCRSCWQKRNVAA